MEVDRLKSMISVTTNTGADTKSGNTNVPTDGVDLSVKDTGAEKGSRVKNATGSLDNGQSASGDKVSGGKAENHEAMSNEFFDKFIQEANSKIFMTNREFSYSVHEATNRVVVKVLDKTTKEVIKEIPPEKNLDAVAKMMELVGIIIDEKI